MNDNMWIGLGVLTLGVLLLVSGALRDRYVWNGGVCRKCGTPWKQFASDTQGSIGCRCACTYEWFSYVRVP